MNQPTTSPSSSGRSCLTSLWGNIMLSEEKLNCFSCFLHLCCTHHNFPSQVRDYSGTYTVKLVPCTSPPSLEYTIPPVCNPREPLTFDLDIRFQQVTSPCLAGLSRNKAKCKSLPTPHTYLTSWKHWYSEQVWVSEVINIILAPSLTGSHSCLCKYRFRFLTTTINLGES